MKASELRLDELFTFEEGRITLQGRRLVLHSMDAFAQYRHDLMDMLGSEQTRRVLTRYAFFSGQADAAAVRRIYPSISLTEWLRAGPRFHSFLGVTRAVVRSLELPRNGSSLLMKLTWHDSAEAEEHLLQLGAASEPVCWMLTGYASGYATYCYERPVFFIETKCRAAGSRVCSAEGRDEASWGSQLDAHRAFFEADDIKERIRHLASQLRKRSRELAQHRRRLEALTSTRSGSYLQIGSESFRRVQIGRAHV